MAETPNRESSSPPKLISPALWIGLTLLLWVVGVAAAALATVLQDIIQVPRPATQTWVDYGLYTPSVLLFVLGTGSMIVAGVRWGMYGRNVRHLPRPKSDTRTVELLESINQRMLYSDTAKRITYRQQDLEALRQTVEQDIEAGHFDAAMVLVSELAQNYGYRHEAEAYRERIATARTADQESKISEAIARLDEMMARHEFDRASREAAKIQRLYPESERVRDLPRKVVQGREQYKQDLERRFLEASENDDVDRAMEILREMDQYLSEEEAAPLRETARGVIGKQRDNLGVQFKMAVQDKQWTQAVNVGERIIRDFPNTRMAEEVRSMIDLLRERAAGQQAARPRQAVRS